MIDLPWNTIEFAECWQDYLDNKKDCHNFEYKNERSMKAALKKLVRYSNNNQEIAIAILENSISEQWRGFFPLKNNDPLMIKYNQNNVPKKEKSLAQKMREDYGLE